MERKGLNSIHAVIAVALALLTFIFGGYILVPLFGEKGTLYAGIPVALIGLLLTRASNTKLSEVFPFKLPPVRAFFGALLLYLGTNYARSVFSLILGLFIDTSARSDSINQVLLKMSPLSAIVTVALIPAVCEEFFCRGFLMRCFAGIKNKWLMIILVGAIFGAMHLDLASFIPTAMFGTLMCYIAYKTNSLLLTMILHFVNNAYFTVIAFQNKSAIEEGVTEAVELYPLQLISLIVFYSVIALLTIYVGYRIFNAKKLFTKSFAIIAAVCLVLLASSLAAFTVGSIKFVHIKYETVNYTEEINTEIPLDINEKGNYVISVNLSSEEGVDVVFVCGDENLKKETGKDIQLVYNFEYTEGQCLIRITGAEGEKIDGGSFTVSYTVARING